MTRQILYLTILIQSVFLCPNLCHAQNPGDDFVPIIKDGKWGYCDRAKNMVIPPQFDGADLFRNGLAFVTLNDKDGLINSKGEFVLEPRYVNLSNLGDRCGNAHIPSIYSHGLKFRTHYKNLDYTIIEITKVDTTEMESEKKYKIFKFFKPDGSLLIDQEINKITFLQEDHKTRIKNKILFKVDSINHYWNEVDSIYKLGTCDELELIQLYGGIYGLNINPEYILDTSGQILYASFLDNINKAYIPPKNLIRIWDKERINKHLIKNLDQILAISFPSVYPPPLKVNHGYYQDQHNGIYNLFTESGRLVDKSKSDQYIYYDQNLMIVSKNGKKTIRSINDGKSIVNSTFSYAKLITDELIHAAPNNSKKKQLYEEINNFGIYSSDGRLFIDTIYKFINFSSTNPLFQCRKDNSDYFFDLKGNFMFECNANSLESITPHIYQYKDTDGYKWYNFTTKKITPVNYSSYSKHLVNGLYIITSQNNNGRNNPLNIKYLINTIGDTIIPNGYNSIDSFNTNAKQLRVGSNGKYGIVNFENEWVLPPDYNYISRHNDRIVLKTDSSAWLTDLSFNKLSKSYLNITLFTNQFISYQENNKLYGYLDRKGMEITQPKYNSYIKFKKDLVLVQFGPENKKEYGWVSLEGIEYF